METMSGYITKLEGWPDLEVSIIRTTKINKVLKAILKLDNIPKEEEFKFKPRSQALLDKWNKLIAADGTPAAEGANGVKKEAAKTNGTNGVKKADSAEKVKEDTESKDGANESPAAEEKAEGGEVGHPESTEQ